MTARAYGLTITQDEDGTLSIARIGDPTTVEAIGMARSAQMLIGMSFVAAARSTEAADEAVGEVTP